MVAKPNGTRLRVLVYLVDYLKDNRFSPTRDEIATAIGLRTRSSLQYHIDNLADDGYIERSRYRHRMLQPTQRGYDVVQKLREIDED